MRRLIIILLLLGSMSCVHRPLEEMGNTHYVRVYVDDVIKNLTTGHYKEDLELPSYSFPRVLRIVLCDVNTGDVKVESFLQNYGEDKDGKYFDGYVVADPGEYNLMVYNFDMESTLILEKDNYFKSKAYTNKIPQHIAGMLPPNSKNEVKMAPVVNEPDHLFIALREGINIPFTNMIDTLYNVNGEYFKAETIVKTYYIQVGVKGIKHVSSAVAVLSGMAGTKVLHNSYMNLEDSVNIYFEMKNAKGYSKQNESSTIYSVFHTFGKLPNVESHYKVVFSFITLDGRIQADTLNITSLFDTDLVKNEQWILIDKEIEIKSPDQIKDGGLSPDVEEWKDEESNIDI